MGRKFRPMVAFAVVGVVALGTMTQASASPTSPIYQQKSANYIVDGASTQADRNRVGQTGASIDAVEGDRLDITATPVEALKIGRLGYRITRTETEGFPAADSGYHDYAEMQAELDKAAKAYPKILQKLSLGKSYEGRDMPLIKISDNVAKDENEPEILYDAHQHAREHLTVEMALYLVKMFTEGYGKDPRITRVVDTREIWIVPDMNPDGGEYDISGGKYRSWRKNRQPVGNGGYKGVDLNRNWGYKFACCDGSSPVVSSETYHGPSAFFAPETQHLRDFVLSRRVNGVQQIKAGIDFHTYSELILWPYGYTTQTTAAGLNGDQQKTFATLGKAFAKSNGYTPEQSSSLYITDGSIIDWLWANQGIWAFTFEMYPTTPGKGGFYPPAGVINRETARNQDASLTLAEYADCAYRAIKKEQQYCTTAPSPR
ncbi:zinc carboxypeptidase [Dactylosporangium vinaceum]|uniref:M14 family metallopeptidase n=1 Tax=Dactylosporangium vinaceum TaxID=53362 RepID=A0ABV5MM12_9ACTN|nr:M14 family metallopeptidase [Dactylosporangium vinaceum]UAB96806.1 zinc carboxypeptidase [Dactylosporangium vinaceum]